MTTRERAEDLVRRFDEPVGDRTNYRVQAMINMIEKAWEQLRQEAVAEEREACAKMLGQEAERIDAKSGPEAYRTPSSEASRLRKLASEMRSRSE